MNFLKLLPTEIVQSITKKGINLLIERREISTCLIGLGDKYAVEYGIQGYKIRSMLLPCGQYEWAVYHCVNGHDKQVESGIVDNRETGFNIAGKIVLELQGKLS